MNDENTKHTFGEDVRLLRKAVGLVWRTEKKFVLCSVWNACISALYPYLEIYLAACIVGELAVGRNVEKMVFYVSALAGVKFFFGVLQDKLGGMKRTLEAPLYYMQEMLLGEKILTMDYENVEKSQIQEQRKRIREYQETYGGDIKTVFGHFEEILCAVIKIPAALLMIGEMFLVLPPEGLGKFTGFLASPVSSVCMIGYALLTSFLMLRISEKNVAVQFSESEQEIGAGRVLDYYTQTYIPNYKTGKDIRLFSQNRLIGQEMDKVRAIHNGINARIMKKVGKYNGARAALEGLLTGIIYLLLGVKAMLGVMSVAGVVQCAQSVQELSYAVNSLMSGIGFARKRLQSMEHLFAFLEIESTKYQGSLPVEKRRDNRYEVEFRDVTFRYPDTSVNVLEHLSCKFVISNKMAVVGRNGSGKTTFIKLLCRLYDPVEGEILLNGIDIRKYDYQEYLGLFSVVFQDFKLFGFALAQNIAAGTGFDEKRVMDCAERVGLAECVAGMKNGILTPVTKDFSGDGTEVSGGEAQKIALARALYKNAPFVILDEPTAALDPLAEAEVYANFDRLVGNKTAVYISHRLSSCRFCDEILVFEGGKIVQRGDHETLVARKGELYDQLWQAQAKYYQ